LSHVLFEIPTQVLVVVVGEERCEVNRDPALAARRIGQSYFEMAVAVLIVAGFEADADFLQHDSSPELTAPGNRRPSEIGQRREFGRCKSTAKGRFAWETIGAEPDEHKSIIRELAPDLEVVIRPRKNVSMSAKDFWPSIGDGREALARRASEGGHCSRLILVYGE
jgi:hypothetical protein